ncbi:hypothetical protein THRCLA_02443 [Thraustotheca clavata]|uniref:Uncharacterized protein n=1 Tax=Thraustotheca clavata TaxID=74557 RepID=A0A1W0A570_9STRA|nr:hypothetical protein THRCLA_02443 [Thraustotheca clavata]
MNSSAAAEAISFLHDLHRMWGGGQVDFAPHDPSYQSFLRHVAIVCFGIGILTFVLLLLIVARRVFFTPMNNSRSAYARMRRRDGLDGSFDVCAVILLGITALSALSGLLAEAQVDYSVHEIAHSMKNISYTFRTIDSVTQNVMFTAGGVQANVDDMIIMFNGSLPKQANELAVEALQLAHVGKDLQKEGHSLPANISTMADTWEDEYFWMKSSTNGIILSMAMSSFLAIAAIGWSMSTALRLAIIFALVIIPSSHALFGLYLSNSIEAADYCMAPANNTLKLFPNSSGITYFVTCPGNTTLYAPAWKQFNSSLSHAIILQQELNDYAKTLPPATRQHLQVGYLDPIHEQLSTLSKKQSEFSQASSCESTQVIHDKAAISWCTYGVLGLFSLWLHQILLCIMLFISVVALVSIYENVRAKEERVEMQYHLLSSYEEDNVEHLYMTRD